MKRPIREGLPVLQRGCDDADHGPVREDLLLHCQGVVLRAVGLRVHDPEAVEAVGCRVAGRACRGVGLGDGRVSDDGSDREQHACIVEERVQRIEELGHVYPVSARELSIGVGGGRVSRGAVPDALYAVRLVLLSCYIII